MIFRLAQTQPVALLEGLSYARGKVAKRRDRHCMRAETYEERELNAPNRWMQSTSYEKKWRYRWQADREREILAILEGWEREVRGRTEEVISEWADFDWDGGEVGNLLSQTERSNCDRVRSSLDEDMPGQAGSSQRADEVSRSVLL